MRYQDAIDRLYDLKRHAIEPGTARTEELLAAVGDPHTAYDSVQIAGTNGKGSTATTLAEILSRDGYRVGLYTSPHLESVRDRIRVDGRPIPEGAVSRFISALADDLDAAGALNRTPTFFEAVTAMALWHFAQSEVDIAVLEVGIGGRHDATSVVDPVAAAVTSVDLDHTDVLGSTVEAIAMDKIAVAEGDIPFVTATEGRARDVVLDERPDGTVVGTDEQADVSVSYEGINEYFEADLSIEAPDWSLDSFSPLLGDRQAVNAGVAASLAQIAWDVDPETIADGIRSVEYPGRAEVVQRDPLVLLDGAHNPAAVEHLTGIIEDLEYDSLHLVTGIMNDKDLSGICAVLPDAASVTVCRPTTSRAAPTGALAVAFEQAGYETIEQHRSVDGAVDLALERAEPGDAVCVTGSLFTVGEARQRWARQHAVGEVRTLADASAALARCNVPEDEIDQLRTHGVHRTIHSRVTHTQAGYLKQQLLSVGGECAVSGVGADGELVDVLMMGTVEQFEELVDSLTQHSRGSRRLGTEIEAALQTSQEPDWGPWPWSESTAVMGIVNVTPDSFYDGGEAETVDAAVDRARSHVEAGADILDIGGESTRPGGDPVPEEIELERIVPVIESVADFDALVSVDTQKATVAEAAVEAGADIVNDVSGLSDPAMAPTVARLDVPIVIAHSLSTPVEPGLPVEYDDVVSDVRNRLGELIRRCERVGIDRSDIIIDPGIGFNKSPAENFELVGRANELRSLGYPVLIGHSQKSMFGGIGYEPGERDVPTIATTAIAAARGADIIRVHDVESTVAAIETAEALTSHDQSSRR